MYNLNLDYYSVEQENREANSFAPNSWCSDGKSALNDVVDPNTEFKITPASLTPASALESYGFSTTPKTKLCRQISKDSTHIIVNNEKHTQTMPASAIGNAVGAQHKDKTSLGLSQEIPRVHGAKNKAISNGTHKTNGKLTSPRPVDSVLAIGKKKQSANVTNGNLSNALETLSLDGDATTTDQLAVAFKNSRADADSNASRCSSVFDLDSNCSERADSFSTLSGASGHEEELFRIRRLLLLDTARSYQATLLNDVDGEDRSCGFQVAGVLSDKMDASARLQEVHAEVEALRRTMTHDLDFDGDLPASNKLLRVKLQELQLDAESKDSAIRGLKLKVASQHADIAALSSRQRAAESRVAIRRNDLEAARKSAALYRDQLRDARAAALRSEQATMSARGAAVSASHAAARLAEEAAAQRSVVEETRSRAAAEKTALVQRLESIHAAMLEREAAILEQLRAEPVPVHARTRSGNSETETQLGELRAALAARDVEGAELQAEVARLRVEAAAAEHRLAERVRLLTASHEAALDEVKASEISAARVAREKAELEVALATAATEKTEVDAAVDRLRDDFARIEQQYQAMQGQAKEAGFTALLGAISEVTYSETHLRELCEMMELSLPETGMMEREQLMVDRLNGIKVRWQNSGIQTALECLLRNVTAVSSGEPANRDQAARGDADGSLLTEATDSDATECVRLRAEMVRLASEGADTLDGVRVALGRSEAMGGVLRTSVARLQRDLDTEQVAHENCKAELERLRADLEKRTMPPPDWETELASLLADKTALQTQVGELRDATQSTLQQNKLLRLRLDALSKPPSVDRLPPPPPPARYDDGGAIAALMQRTELNLPRNEPLADLQGCLDSLKMEMATLQQQLIAKSRGED